MDDDMRDEFMAAINELAQKLKAKKPHLINPNGEPTDVEAIEFVQGMAMYIGGRDLQGLTLTRAQLAGYNYAAKDVGKRVN
jgi:hypothetical protein